MVSGHKPLLWQGLRPAMTGHIVWTVLAYTRRASINVQLAYRTLSTFCALYSTGLPGRNDGTMKRPDRSEQMRKLHCTTHFRHVTSAWGGRPIVWMGRRALVAKATGTAYPLTHHVWYEYESRVYDASPDLSAAPPAVQMIRHRPKYFSCSQGNWSWRKNTGGPIRAFEFWPPFDIVHVSLNSDCHGIV